VISYLQAIVIGLLQGVTELFPISSLGHSVLVPAWLGWHSVVDGQSADESAYLAFLVGLHVATALVLVWCYRSDWARITGGFLRTLRTRRIETVDERMAWLLVVATIPVGLTGLALEHTLRTLFAKPLAAAIFLTLNGLVLLGGHRVRRHALVSPAGAQIREPVADGAAGVGVGEPRRDLATLEVREAGVIGLAQVGALFAGISRSGITMVCGLLRGLSHEDAVRFSFLLATPVILAAGVYKLHDLTGPNGDGIRGQVLVGSLCAAVAAYAAVRFLTRYFHSHDLDRFGWYCLAAGILSIIHFA
jgi:undecaprenyl-diphosphatase